MPIEIKLKIEEDFEGKLIILMESPAAPVATEREKRIAVEVREKFNDLLDAALDAINEENNSAKPGTLQIQPPTGKVIDV